MVYTWDICRRYSLCEPLNFIGGWDPVILYFGETFFDIVSELFRLNILMFLKFWGQGKLEEQWGGKAGGEKYSKMLKNAKNGLDAYYLLSRYVKFRSHV